MERPDFEQLAREVYDICTLQSLADRFRQVWNARGAADIARLDVLLTDQSDHGTGTIGVLLNTETFERTLRELDV